MVKLLYGKHQNCWEMPIRKKGYKIRNLGNIIYYIYIDVEKRP